jgi:hypothetical protein
VRGVPHRGGFDRLEAAFDLDAALAWSLSATGPTLVELLVE